MIGESKLARQARLSWAAVGLLVAAVVACRLLAVQSFPIYDDAFITFRYAQNMAEGQGLVFNPGADWEPVLGTTTPLYALALAGLVSLGLDVIQAALSLNILCDAISALLIIALLGRRTVASSIAVAAFAAIPQISRISVGGMEPPLLVALMLGAIVLSRAKRPALAGTLAAACCLVRPEALILVFALAWGQRHEVRALVRYSIPVLAIGVAAVTVMMIVYGQPLPQSVVAKANHSTLVGRFSRVKDILAQAFGPNLPMRILSPLVALGFLRGLSGSSRLAPFFLQAIGMVIAYALVGTKTWGWYFFVPLTAWTIALGLASESVVERVPVFLKLNREGALAKAMPVALTVLAIASMASVSKVHRDRITPNVYLPIADWADDERLAQDRATIVASDIGAVGFYTRAIILDSEGLVWPDALDYPNQVELVRALKPDFAVWVVNTTRLGSFLADPELLEAYHPVMRFNEDRNADLDPDPLRLPWWWEQDYIVFERVDRE